MNITITDVILTLATAAPGVLLLAIAYPLRPQYGRLRARPVPARQIIDRLADETRRGLIPAGPFGDTTRPPMWTVTGGLIHIDAARATRGAVA